MRKQLSLVIKYLSSAILLTTVAFTSYAKSQAVILQYHHVSNDMPPSTSVTPEVFSEHLQYIAENYTVLPLQKVIEALQKDSPLPDNAVAITFDDGYKNILENAHPQLKYHGFPYTIFVNPILIGTRKNLLTHEELKQMSQEGVSIANHYLGHDHMLYQPENVSRETWLKNHKNNILLAEDILKDYIGSTPGYIAYPYGEYNQEIQQLVKELNLVGFGQHSGAVSSQSDFTALPRYPASGVYGNLKTLKVKLNSLALPIIKNSVDSPELSAQGKTPDWTLKIELDDIYPSQVACFYQNQTLELTWNENTVNIELPAQFPTGRSRVNCTAPSKANRQRYYWYSQPFFVPTERGDWLD
ncbi:polysaccharide deacetylase family protein [Paraneptunicella aestuarii]|uniref:polysaccharide deacetylase family protein n=1 Tax=Paraneptunicella aestuarii TaxID=2831148 RepID=UPI001E4FD665|nr:polysaccharide deacetylase family protein [Paraneptunicella aestuarii]UAA38875.1 polysaccharide deacetylase family protein [Paraneptunicella aestuarii]